MRAVLRPRTLLHYVRNVIPNRQFSTSPALLKSLPGPLPPILDTDITENFLKGSGPGGQKINKTNSAVQILHHPTGLIVKCQETRSRSQNRKIARRRLAERIEELQLGSEARTAKKAAKEAKKKSSATKKRRRKYRQLDAAKRLDDNEGEEDADDVNEPNEVEEVKQGKLDGVENKDKAKESSPGSLV
ncbi:hypothetical protein EJ05DRAFT_124753 [Pseudovirgaria hyperparasitica]|uniref:Prokaryotic-type class I peptide chain release factors domain-containing protein n=1 Tax=Pseudovirgaria hyperparasitica TaxID=470096 RepID=A0A6A6VZR5_9PEZI|nr:uncharacterized protein EJ05DRAFT_124753 [Pseudovirgaria hyperparasitica]KAF2755170.1 hypothetical protein EJ05DRAFT_124753 [Pseudovirgaria hyperparasitica]